jgi:BirA family biotin operon repressor/biotin-[acetyl-CoA-carboxylase] ligase
MAGRILWFPEATSTNDLAATLAERGADEGSVIVADMQTAGRGRFGRSWSSPPGAGVYASVVLRPELRVAPLLTIAAGVAIAEGVAAATGLHASLSWPNDVFVGSAKLAGILAEAAATHVIVGVGINVLPAAYPPDVAARATSIGRELGRPVDRGQVLAECLAALWRRYQDLIEFRERAVIAAWRTRAAPMIGRAIEWQHHGTVERGHAKDVDETGALLMTTETGVIRIISGEVRWT